MQSLPRNKNKKLNKEIIKRSADAQDYHLLFSGSCQMMIELKFLKFLAKTDKWVDIRCIVLHSSEQW